MNIREAGTAESEEFSRSPEARAFFAHLQNEDVLGMRLPPNWTEEKLKTHHLSVAQHSVKSLLQ